MPKMSPMHQYVHGKIREAFGPPDNSLGRDDHWSLRPDGQYIATINVLVNGSADVPAIWIFDPHSRSHGVFRAAIKKEEDVHKVLKQIQHRLQRAAAAAAKARGGGGQGRR